MLEDRGRGCVSARQADAAAGLLAPRDGAGQDRPCGVEVLVDRPPLGVDRSQKIVDGDAGAGQGMGVEVAWREGRAPGLGEARDWEAEDCLADASARVELEPSR